MAKKITVQGNYQYAEADAKLAMAVHSFGWLTGRRTEHENAKGEKVFTVRRDLQIANDPIIKKIEKRFSTYYNKAKKKMTCRHRWGQFFAILFTVVGLALGICFFLAGMLQPVGDIINPIKDTIKDMIAGMLDGDMAGMIVDNLQFALLGIGVISLLSIFINNGRYKKRMITPKRKYAKKYNAIAQGALKEGAERLYALKADNRNLMTKNDRKLADLGATFQRLIDRNVVDEYE